MAIILTFIHSVEFILASRLILFTYEHPSPSLNGNSIYIAFIYPVMG
jgi:hypothetical protein